MIDDSKAVAEEIVRGLITSEPQPEYDELQLTRMVVEGVAWLAAYAVERPRFGDQDLAMASADRVADHFARRFGVRQ